MKKLCCHLISAFLLLSGSITLANGEWVAVGWEVSNPIIITSADGSSWTRIPLSQNTFGLSGVAHDDSGNWVAVGEDILSYKAAILYSRGSTNNWVAITPPTDDDMSLSSVTWANNMWVAVGNKIGSPHNSAVIMTSSNGTTWNIVKSLIVPKEVDLATLSSVSYANGKWVVVGDSNLTPSTGGYFESGAIGTSIDGVTWTFQSPPFRYHWPTFYTITYNGSGSAAKWAAVGQDGLSEDVATSNDGLSWSVNRMQLNCMLFDIAYGNNQWMVIGLAGTTAPFNSCVLTSQNATTWVPATAQLNGYFRHIGYGDNTWIAVGHENYVAVSKDNGTTWSYPQIPTSNTTTSIMSIAYSN